jgi:hypothetical protein
LQIYTEPLIGQRLTKKLDALGESDVERFKALRGKWCRLGAFALHLYSPIMGIDRVKALTMPVRRELGPAYDVPEVILEATTFRGLLDRLLEQNALALTEFNAIFGGQP